MLVFFLVVCFFGGQEGKGEMGKGIPASCLYFPRSVHVTWLSTDCPQPGLCQVPRCCACSTVQGGAIEMLSNGLNVCPLP